MFKNRILYILPLLFLFTQCTLDGFDADEMETITEDMLESASLILGDVISEDSNGIFLSVQDAIAIVAGQGIQPKVMTSKQKESTKEKFDFIENYKSWYEKETGKHIIIFDRIAYDKRSYERDSLNYIYQDKNGEFIVYPQEQEEQVNSIRYSGFKDGVIDSRNVETRPVPTKTTKNYRQQQKSYNQISNFLIYKDNNGNKQQPFIEGEHVEKGTTLEYSEKDGKKQTQYEFSLNFLDMRLSIEERDDERVEVKEDIERDNTRFESRRRRNQIDFVGLAEWKMISTEKQETHDNTTQLSGTMVFEGDGWVVIKFDNSDQTITLDIKTGRNIDDKVNEERRETYN